jgi:hypothetical protein
MRTAKDKVNVPKRSYRPEQQRCPHCGFKLKRSYKVWDKYLASLSGRSYVISWGYRCANPACPEPGRVYRSQAAEKLHVPHGSYGRDVIVEVGYQRFWQQRTIAEIHQSLSGIVSISERQVQHLLGSFLALLRAGQGTKIERHQATWAELGGLVLAVDGMQPEKGNPALYVVREVQLGVTLIAEVLENGDHDTLIAELFEPIQGWPLPVKGIVSDAQESLRLAIAEVWPDKPHQTCQLHCLQQAARPIFNADRAMKVALKHQLRGRLNRVRARIKALAATDPYRAVLLKYVQSLRFTLLSQGCLPFELGGLQMIQDLTTLHTSLNRARQKGGIAYWIA